MSNVKFSNTNAIGKNGNHIGTIAAIPKKYILNKDKIS